MEKQDQAWRVGSERDTFPLAKIFLPSLHGVPGTGQSGVDTLSLTNTCLEQKIGPLSARE